MGNSSDLVYSLNNQGSYFPVYLLLSYSKLSLGLHLDMSMKLNYYNLCVCETETCKVNQ